MIVQKYKPRIVAVTGSVGKTSSKDAIFSVFRSFFRVRKSDKSFNSEIGIPLTIIGCHNAWSDVWLWAENIWQGFTYILFTKDYPKWLVLEVGADRPGDIRRVSKWLKSDVVVITRFGKVPSHVEYFSSPEQVILEKSYLAKAVKHDGILILNHDDEDVLALEKTAKSKVLTYGLNPQADVVASNYSILYSQVGSFEFPTGVAFKVDYTGTSIPVTLPGALGRSHVYPVLSAITAGISQDINLVSISNSLLSHTLPPGRMNIISGIKETFIIDDTYNSSPVALQEAIATFNEVRNQHYKIAVLGDMLEIGKYTVEEHQKVGESISKVANILIAVGIRSRYIAEGALGAGMSEKNIFQFEDSREAGKFLQTILEPGDIILVKGSQGVRMERVVEEVMAHPEDKEKLLVRQDKEWQNR